MADTLSLKKLTFYYTIGNLTSRVIKFALFFVYTFFLTKSDLGYFDLLTNTITLIAPILALQLYDATLRWCISNNSELALKQVASASIFIVIFNLLLFTLVYAATAYYTRLQYAALIYISVILQTIYPVILQFARGSGKNAVYAISGVLFTVVFAISTIVALILFNLKIEGLLIANILALAVTIIYLSFRLEFYRYVHIKFFSKKTAKEMILYSVPLIPNTLSWWAISTADRYIILAYLGIASNGLFAVATKFPSMLLMLHSIFNMAWQERAMRTYNTETRDEYYSSVLDKYFTFFFCTIAIAIAVTKPFFRIAIQSAYYSAWELMPFMYLAIGFQALASFYGSGYLSSRDTKGALTTTIFGVIVSIMSNFILIPWLGLLGSSISFLAGFLVMFIVRVYQTRKYFSIRFPVKKMLFIGLIILVVSLVTIADNIYILFANVFFALIAFVLFNKQNIAEHLPALKFMGKKKLTIVNT